MINVTEMNKRITTEQLSELRGIKSISFINTLLESGGYPLNILDVETIDYPSFDLESNNKYKELATQDSIDYFALARLLYESLSLTSKQASDNLFWSYLNLTKFFPLIQKVEKSKISNDLEDDEKSQKILDNYFLIPTLSQNTLIKSFTAGLWWSIHLTIDDSLNDKYYYSKVFLSEKHLKDKNLGTYQLIRDKKTLHAILEFYEQHKNSNYNGIKVGTEAFAQQLSKLLNQIGGLTVLSYLSKNEVKDKLETYKETILKRALRVKERKVISRVKILDEKRSNNPVTDITPEEVSIEENPNEKVTNNNDVNSTIVKQISIFENGDGYFYKDRFMEEAPFKIQITEENLKNGKVLFTYNNYKVNQVVVSSFLKNRMSYNNCLHNLTRDVKLLKLEIINSEKLIGVLQKINFNWHIKFIKTSLLKNGNSNLRANGLTIVCNDIDSIQEFRTKLITSELAKKLEGVILPEGLRTQGVLLNGSTFRSFKDAIIPYWPELNKLLS